MHILLQQPIPALYVWKTADVRFIYTYTKLSSKPLLKPTHPTFRVKLRQSKKTRSISENCRKTESQKHSAKRTPGVRPVHPVALRHNQCCQYQVFSNLFLKIFTDHSLSRQSLHMIIVRDLLPQIQFESSLLHLNSPFCDLL